MKMTLKSLNKMVDIYLHEAYEQHPPLKVDAKQWREDWDDEDINDDFTQQLKKQLNVE